MAGQGMLDRRREGGERREEAEFIVSERLLSFGCIRVSGAAAEAEDDKKDDGKKTKDKAKPDKEKKPEAASATAPAVGEAERKEVRVEEVRLINTSAVEAQLFLSLSATAPAPLTSPFTPPTAPSTAESSAPAATARGKKESKAAAATAPAVVATATVSPPPPTPVVLGPFSLPFSSVVIAAHSSVALPITLSLPVSSAAALHTAFLSACVAHSTSCLSFALQAEACKEAVAAAAADLDCGRVQVGEEREEAVLIRNTGLLPARLRCELSFSASVASPAAFSCELDGKDLLVAAGAEERVVVRFVPSAASPSACALTLRSAFTVISVPVRGEGCVQAVRVTDGAELQRVEAAGGLAPVLDMGELLPADGGKTLAFRITNQSADLLRFVLTPPPQPTAAADIAPPASAASTKKKAGDKLSLPGAGAATAAGAAGVGEDSKSDFVFAPSLGHLLPGESKLLRVTLRSDAARVYRQARVGLETTRIRREDVSNSRPWDEEMTLLRWLSVDEQQRARQAAQQQREAAEQKAQEAAEAEAAKQKKSGKQPNLKSPRPAPPPAAVSSSPPPSAPITGPLLTSTPVPEPAFVAVDAAAPASVPLFISAVVDRPRLLVRRERVDFPLISMLDRKEEQLEVINASALATGWRWELTGDEGAADCFDISPRSGTVAGNGSAAVTVSYAPRRDGKHDATAVLLSSSSSSAVHSVALSGSASRPVYVLQLPPAAFPCPPLTSLLPAGVSSDGLRVVCCESVGVNVRTMLRLSVINTSDGDWKFDCSCDDQPDASGDRGEKTEEVKTTTLPAIAARSSAASSSQRSLPSPSQPFVCHSPTGLIRAGESREVLFSFSPSASCPPASAACCSRWSFAANGLVTAVALIGRVVEPVVTVLPPSLLLAFEPTLLSHSRQQSLSISNPHPFPLSFYTSVLSAAATASVSASSTVPSSPVSLLPAKGIIGGGESVSIAVRYAPRQVGSDGCRIVIAFPRKRERVFLRVRGSGYSLVTKVIALDAAETAKEEETAAEPKVAVKKTRARRAAVQVTAGAAGRREESKEQIMGEGAVLTKTRTRGVSGKRAAAL